MEREVGRGREGEGVEVQGEGLRRRAFELVGCVSGEVGGEVLLGELRKEEEEGIRKSRINKEWCDSLEQRKTKKNSHLMANRSVQPLDLHGRLGLEIQDPMVVGDLGSSRS